MKSLLTRAVVALSTVLAVSAYVLGVSSYVLAASPASAVEPVVQYSYKAKVVRIKDGDTIVVDVDLGFNTWVHNETLRFLRVHAPELTGASKEAGKATAEALKKRLQIGEAVTIMTVKDKKDLYGRYLAEVWDSDGNVNDFVLSFMSSNGFAPGR